MIEIKKISNSDAAKKICAQHGIEWNEKYHVIATLEQGIVLHCAIFEYTNEVGEIYAISGFAGDLSMLDGLCRAILNIMDINGVKKVFMPLKYAELAKKIGFESADDRFCLNLDGFFKCGCCH